MTDKIEMLEPPRPRREKLLNLPNQKVAVLIDDDNLSIDGERNLIHKIDYQKLLTKAGPREILRALLYRPAKRNKKHGPSVLQSAVEEYGIEVKTPPKNADCWLTIDAVSLAAKVDVIVLVGGDKDYLPLVHYLKAQGCRVEVLSWPDKMATCLRDAADRYVPLGDDILQQAA